MTSPLHAILDVDLAGRRQVAVTDLARSFFDGGARVVQLRAKLLASAPFLEQSECLVRLAEPYKATVIINDRVDIALLAGAAGAHVGQDDLPPAAARRLLGQDAVVGYSTHTVAQIEAAAREPVTYIAVGPVFGTATKETGYEPVGLDLVAEAARLAGRLPVVAIGGITLDTAPQVIAAGASSVAIISDLLVDDDPAARVAAYCRVLSL